MPTIDFGFGYPGTPSLAAALAAAAPGDTIVSYGDTPFYLDPTPSTTWLGAKTGITWNHAGGGDYIFDGGLATNDGLRIDGTGNTLNLRNVRFVRVTDMGLEKKPKGTRATDEEVRTIVDNMKQALVVA